MAAKLKKKEIQGNLDAWASGQNQITSINAKLAKDKAKVEEKYADTLKDYKADLEALQTKASKKIEPLQTRVNELDKLIRAAVAAYVDDSGKQMVCEVKSDSGAYVSVVMEKGSRSVSFENILKLCDAKGVAVSDVVSVVLKDADAKLGKKEIDAVATLPEKPKTVIGFEKK